MSIASVQIVANPSVSTGGSLTFSSPVTAGNLIVVYGFHSYSGCPPTITNSEGSTVTAQIAGNDGAGLSDPLWVFTMVAVASGTYSVTATMGCGVFRLLVAEEVSGYNTTTPIETTEFDNQRVSGATSITVGPKNAAAGADVRVFCYGAVSAYTGTAGWVGLLNTTNYFVQRKAMASAGAISAVVTMTPSSTLDGTLFSINPAAGASSSTLAFQNMPSTAVVLAGSTSNIREIRLWGLTGAPKTGVVAADITCYFRADGGTRAARTVVTGTINTFVSLGLKEVDATNEPGLYQFCPADADVATKGCYKYTMGGTGLFGELEVEVFASDPFAASVTAQDVADASRDDAILMLQDGYARPTVSGNMTLKDSTGSTQNIAITTDVNALPIVSTT